MTSQLVNSSTDTLAVATTNFNAPTLTTVGSLGVDLLRANGFEIAGGVGYGAFNVDAGTSLPGSPGLSTESASVSS